MADMMAFPETVEEFMEQYKITDRKQIYTNGAELVPIFRMKQWFEHKPELQWIQCSEKLPEEDIDVLCQTSSGTMFVASYGILYPWSTKKGWITAEFNRFSKEMIEAWMPLPES